MLNLWRTIKMRDINYNQVLDNVNNMINLLEYDAMRSPGKTKVNADNLVSLYTLKDRYTAVVAPTVKEEAVVEAPVKKTVGRPAKANTEK